MNVLEQQFHIGQRYKFQYVKATLYARSRTLSLSEDADRGTALQTGKAVRR